MAISESEVIEWEVLTPDVIRDLLFDGVQDEDDDSDGEYDLTTDLKITESLNLMESAENLMYQVNPSTTLSEYGRSRVCQLITEFSKDKKAATVVRHYPAMVSAATDFFDEKLSQNEASKLLLDIMRKIASPVKEDCQTVAGNITCHENDMLEYIGGFTLRKAKARFPHHVLENICSNTSQGSLVKIMEYKAGALLYPSEEYLFYLQHVYLMFSREACKNPSDINFSNVSDKVLAGQYCESFICRISSISDFDEGDEYILRGLTTYMTKLFVRVLSYSFAKKLFSRMHQQVTKQSPSFRASLMT